MSTYLVVGKRFEIINHLFGSCRINETIDEKCYQEKDEDENKSFDKSHEKREKINVGILYIFAQNLQD